MTPAAPDEKPTLADRIGFVALLLAKDATYRHRAAEDLLRIAAELRAAMKKET